MYHPTTRVLTVLELLQSRGRMGGPELARRLEVELRTVRRYITMLQDLGIPVEAARGPGGGYSLRPGFKLPPLMFSNEEALAVTFGLMNARRQGIPTDPHALEGALSKIERVLPEGLRARVQAVQSSVDFVAQPAGILPPSDLVLLFSAAVQEQRCVKLNYRSETRETERRVDPYGIVSHWEYWYVVGWCHLRHGIRIFRLDRIVTAELETITFERPEPFDSLEYVLESLPKGVNGWSVEVFLETTMTDARHLLPPGTAVLQEAPGGVVFKANVPRLEWLARLMLTWERDFVIRYPPELRQALQAVADHAHALAQRES